jgi:hypothetical protein
MATRKTETKRGDLPKSKLIWRGFQLLIVFAVAMLLCLVCVSEYSVAWHALHGNSIAYEGWRIRIPKKFYERDFDDKPAFWNLSFGIPLWNAPYAHISVFRVSARQQPFSYKEDYEKFSRGVTAVAEQKGYTFWEKKVVPVASPMRVSSLSHQESVVGSVLGFSGGQTIQPPLALFRFVAGLAQQVNEQAERPRVSFRQLP